MRLESNRTGRDALPGNLAARYQRLVHIVRAAGRAVVAFSGGTDSTCLLAVCADVLKDQVLAVTAQSALLPWHELARARKTARQLAVRHRILATEDLAVTGLVENFSERCYFCKKNRFKKIWKMAAAEGCKTIFDGSHRDDDDDFRPGMKALRELGIRSPLAEAGIGKADIRRLSRFMGLATWDQPSNACLATRIPYGTAITLARLSRIAMAEDYLRQQGMRIYRVRDHGTIARLELGAEEMQRLFDGHFREQVVHRLVALGYCYVALDLKEFRSGSMNAGLPEAIWKST